MSYIYYSKEFDDAATQVFFSHGVALVNKNIKKTNVYYIFVNIHDRIVIPLEALYTPVYLK